MVFKVDWEKAHTQYNLPHDVIKQMIQSVYPERVLSSFQVIEGGCANINVKLNFID